LVAVLENEIIKLVNDEKLRGTHEIEFSASGLNSGVYFYNLRAGSFAVLRKMILLKHII